MHTEEETVETRGAGTEEAGEHPGLVLTRRPGQTVVIGRDATVRVTVVAIRGDQVRLHFAAPRDVDVDREEIFAVKKAERETRA